MYNIEQRKAIEDKHDKIVIIAPPGSGKTHTMVGAVEHYIKEKNPKRVVAITFTRKAAGELRKKIFNKTIVETATIHSWSLSQLNRLSREHGFRVRILQDEQIMSILKPMIKDYSIHPNLKYKLFHYVMGDYNIDIPEYVKSKFKTISGKYIQFKRDRHLYDFTDLPLYLKDKLVDFDAYVTDIDGLFVDEFQDVDPIQLEVFNRVLAKEKFYIGDPDQAIYIFRGATADIFHSLQDFYVHNLKVNYRSYQEILDYAVTFRNEAVLTVEADESLSILSVEDKFESNILAHRGTGASVLIQSGNEFVGYGSGVRFEDNNAMQVGYEIINHQPQILCRTNKEVDRLTEAGYGKVSTIHKAKGLEFDNVIVCDFAIEEEENINVAYVALTRAANRLMVTTTDTLMAVTHAIPEDAKASNGTKKLF